MKRKYNLIFGLGPACSCTQTIRRAGLQLLSFPFDWIGPKTDTPEYDSDVRRRVDFICAGFAGWFKSGDFECLGDISSTGKACCFNRDLKLLFIHDFPIGRPIEESFDAILDKYKRRIARFQELLASARHVLVVRLDRPDLPVRTQLDDCRYARQELAKHFPHATFDMILLQPDPGIPFERRTLETLEPGLMRMSFDYADRTPGMPPYQVRLDKTGEALADLYSVRDYRTRDERKRWKEARLRERLRGSGAKNLCQYRLWKLRHSLEKRFGFLRALPWLCAGERVDQILPLGTNCEVAFRFYSQWGFLDSSLFAWAQSFDLGTLTAALRDLDRIFSGGTEFDRKSFMWKCSVTGLYFHGAFKAIPNVPPPSAAELEADLSALHGRIRHLRDKFREYVANEKPTLFVHRLCPKDAAAPDLERRLAALEQALADRLAARNWRLLVVCEEKERARMPEGPNRLFRTVKAFSPPDRVTDPGAGDPHGWRAIFTEFVPAKILPKAHKFKFE